MEVVRWHGLGDRMFLRILQSVFLVQALLFLLFFVPSVSIMMTDVTAAIFYSFGLLIVISMVLLARHGGLGPFKPTVYVKNSIFSLFANVAMASFIVLNLIECLIVLSAGTHQILYTEGSFGLEIIPLKILAFPAYFLAVSRLMIADKISKEKLAIISLLSILLTGSRGLPIFGLIAIILYRMGLGIIFRSSVILIVLALIIIFLSIGYVREPIEMDVHSYLILVIGSLNQFAMSNLNIDQCAIDPGLVLHQFSSIFFGAIDTSRVTYWLTECVSPGATIEGYGVASSIAGEALILNPSYWLLIYILVMCTNAFIIASLMTSRSPALHIVGCAWLPFVIYSVRAEIVYPYVFLIKIVSSLLILTMLQSLVRASMRRSAQAS